eukprot:scaffold19122_cov68-Skeletonema_dohrnii-CCMP3373.AAC.1
MQQVENTAWALADRDKPVRSSSLYGCRMVHLLSSSPFLQGRVTPLLHICYTTNAYQLSLSIFYSCHTVLLCKDWQNGRHDRATKHSIIAAKLGHDDSWANLKELFKME